MRWLSSNRRTNKSGTPGQFVAFVDRSWSMEGEPTVVLEQALPQVCRMLPGLTVLTFDAFSNIKPRIEQAIDINPERSIVISDGYISGSEHSQHLSGSIDAIFCGEMEEMQALPRRIQDRNYTEWPDYDGRLSCKYAVGVYTLWEMTRGRGVLNHFPWKAGPRALIDLIVHRQRRFYEERLPDQHIYLGRRG